MKDFKNIVGTLISASFLPCSAAAVGARVKKEEDGELAPRAMVTLDAPQAVQLGCAMLIGLFNI